MFEIRDWSFDHLIASAIQHLIFIILFMKTVYYLTPSSFCFWVKRSIDELNKIIDQHTNDQIYCIHALVHNPKVTQSFEGKWIHFVDSIDEVQDTNAIIIFSAHWTNRIIISAAEEKFKAVYNLECPFVTKIYKEVDNLVSKWINTLFYIGKPQHQEGKNVIDYATSKKMNLFVFQNISDIPSIDPQTEFGVLTQTTLNYDYVQNILNQILNIYPHAHLPALSDVCKATYERQKVIQENLDKFDTFVVIGWKESNNTKELYNIWIQNNKKTFYGESLKDILINWKEILFSNNRIAITWWASTPIQDIQEVFQFYKENWYEPKILALKD